MRERPPVRRGRPQVPESELQEKIYQAAITVLESRGYDATSIEEVARTASMAKKTVYRFHSNKQALIEAVILRWSSVPLTLLARIPAGPAGVLPILEEMLYTLAQRVLTREAVALFKLFQHEFAGKAELLHHYRSNGVENAQRVLQLWFARLHEKQLINPGWQPQQGEYLLNMAIAARLRDMALGSLPPVPQTPMRQHIREVLAFVSPLLLAPGGQGAAQ